MQVKPPKSIHPIRYGPGLVRGPITVTDKIGEALKAKGWVEVETKPPARKRTRQSGEGR